jgi:hypothetical protein
MTIDLDEPFVPFAVGMPEAELIFFASSPNVALEMQFERRIAEREGRQPIFDYAEVAEVPQVREQRPLVKKRSEAKTEPGSQIRKTLMREI